MRYLRKTIEALLLIVLFGIGFGTDAHPYDYIALLLGGFILGITQN